MLTVLIATRNGGATLGDVLKTYRSLMDPPGGYRLIVIDNGSTDDTPKIVVSFADSLPLRLVTEPLPGKNVALNRALPEIAGDLVVLSDDDVFPRPDWLVHLRAAADAHPEFAIFGGKTLPRWEATPEDWILRWVPLGPTFGLSNSTLAEGPVDPNRVFGSNMAVRSAVFAAGHRFDTTIGPGQSQSYAMGSDTEFVQRLASGGMRAWHVGDAIVEHFIRKRQLTEGWLLGRAERFGRGAYRISSALVPPAAPRWGGVPRYLIRQALELMVAIAGASLRADRERRFRARWQLQFTMGQIREARAARHDKAVAGTPVRPGSRH